MRDDFLKHSESKEQLNKYLADKFISFHSGSKIVTITFENNIRSTDPELLQDLRRINDFTAEEADLRLVTHAIGCVEKGYKNVVLRTVDTDVLFLLIGNFH